MLDDEDYPTLDDLLKSIKLANAYVEYLDPSNKKAVRALAKEYQVGRTVFQDRVNGKSRLRMKKIQIECDLRFWRSLL